MADILKLRQSSFYILFCGGIRMFSKISNFGIREFDKFNPLTFGYFFITFLSLFGFFSAPSRFLFGSISATFWLLSPYRLFFDSFSTPSRSLLSTFSDPFRLLFTLFVRFLGAALLSYQFGHKNSSYSWPTGGAMGTDWLPKIHF